jgi:hypothetical protein
VDTFAKRDLLSFLAVTKGKVPLLLDDSRAIGRKRPISVANLTFRSSVLSKKRFGWGEASRLSLRKLAIHARYLGEGNRYRPQRI